MLAVKVARTKGVYRTLGCKEGTVAKRGYGASGKRVHVDTHDFFKADPKLIEKRKASPSLHYVFLEGLAGSGKHELLDRLQKVRRPRLKFEPHPPPKIPAFLSFLECLTSKRGRF